jgi:hypothetical protein
MKRSEILARIREEPRHLYWRYRLLTSDNAPRVPKALLVESLRLLARGWPATQLPLSALGALSLEEVRDLLRLVRRGTERQLHLFRAQVLAQAGISRADELEFQRAASAALERLPLGQRLQDPVLWGTLLLATKPGAFEVHLEAILKSLRPRPRATLWSPSPWQWMKDPRISEAGRRRIRAFFVALPDTALRASLRMELAEQDGLLALSTGELPEGRVALAALTRWAAVDAFPGNHLKLIDAAMEKGVLRAQCLKFLRLVLSREWRDWVRPGIEQRFEALKRPPVRLELVQGPPVSG